MRRIAWVLVITGTFAGTSMLGEEIQLKNGNKITGKLTGISGDDFQVKTAYGDMKVPRSEVIASLFRKINL